MLLLGRRGSFEDVLLLPVPELVVADGAINGSAFLLASSNLRYLRRLAR